MSASKSRCKGLEAKIKYLHQQVKHSKYATHKKTVEKDKEDKKDKSIHKAFSQLHYHLKSQLLSVQF
jgi:hypothetical protein